MSDNDFWGFGVGECVCLFPLVILPTLWNKPILRIHLCYLFLCFLHKEEEFVAIITRAVHAHLQSHWGPVQQFRSAPAQLGMTWPWHNLTLGSRLQQRKSNVQKSHQFTLGNQNSHSLFFVCVCVCVSLWMCMKLGNMVTPTEWIKLAKLWTGSSRDICASHL